MSDASGGVLDRYAYTPFGLEVPQAQSGQPFRYTGRYYDAETGLLHYRARYYDPAWGRFLETDPVLYADQMNLYAYVGNDPLNATDPTGMCTQDLADSGLACGAADAISRVIEPVVESAMLAAGLEVVPEGERDPEGIGSYEAPPNSVAQEAEAIAGNAATAVLARVVPGKGRGATVGSKIDPKGTTKASEIETAATDVGFRRTQIAGGPVKFEDESGVARVTVKSGSPRTPGSAGAHVELKDSSGRRVSPLGKRVSRKGAENHTPIVDDR